MVEVPTKIHLTFRTDASGSVLIDKASPEPFVGSEEFVRAQGWRPIESAPMQTPFLAWCPYVGRVIMLIDGAHRSTWAIDRSGRLGCDPTHWQPLPPSPSEKGVG